MGRDILKVRVKIINNFYNLLIYKTIFSLKLRDLYNKYLVQCLLWEMDEIKFILEYNIFICFS